ncbi:hypothetical protein Sjap_012018 [Stephania japonica]|uniref:Sm domain-containing protein n=1 Tax=Stephania japonica TaxID=461633 RepID=A0AAP0P8K7_9MAGN
MSSRMRFSRASTTDIDYEPLMSDFEPSTSDVLSHLHNTGDKAMNPSMVHTEKPNVSLVKKLLFRRMLVGVKDGRFFVGAFHCMDKQGNIILQDAVEYRSTRRSSPSPMEHRSLGLILIPSSCRSSCHVDFSIEEQASLLSLQGVGENNQPE